MPTEGQPCVWTPGPADAAHRWDTTCGVTIGGGLASHHPTRDLNLTACTFCGKPITVKEEQNA